MRNGARAILWTEKQLAWVKTHLSMTTRQAHEEFCRKFKIEVSLGGFSSLCKRMGWKRGKAWLRPGYVSPITDRNWPEDQLAWVEANKNRPRKEAYALFCKLFKTTVSFGAYNGLCKRKGWMTGRDGRMQPGGVSWNKGKKMPFNPNSARTQFKKGQTPHNTKEVGHEWMHPDGYVYIIAAEKNPHTGYKHRSVMKHKLLWEQKNGKIKKGMVLKCLDDNKLNTDPSNWEAVPLGVNALLNSRWSSLRYNDAPGELKPTVMAVAKLRHARAAKIKERASP